MNITQLRAASDFCKIFGAKMLVYGGPGTGKTPMILSAPAPVLCATEPGLLSIRNSNIPVWGAWNYALAKEFVDWAVSSPEARQFQTFGFDSVSQLAENTLSEELPKHRDGRKAFGEMSKKVMELLTKLYYAPSMHVYLVAKETSIEVAGATRMVPYFPGKDLYVKIPHLFDIVARVSYKMNPSDSKQYRVFETQDSFNFTARDRTGKLAPIESADIGYIINKVMS